MSGVREARRSPRISSGAAFLHTAVAVMLLGMFMLNPFPANAFSFGWQAPAAIDAGHSLNDVSCASTTFCIAVDNGGNVLTFTGSAWSAPLNIDGTTALEAVSCPSASFCVAVDAKGNAFQYNGSTWSGPTVVDSKTDAVAAVSCTSSSFCMMANGIFNTTTSSWNGDVSSFNGTGWSAPVTLDTAGYFSDVSCTSSTFCAAVEWGTHAYTYNGSAWSAPSVISGSSFLNGISCVTSSYCVATDWNGDGSTYNGSTWSAEYPIDTNNLAGVSCPLTTFCMALGYYNGTAIASNGSSWDTPLVIDSTKNDLFAISCVNAGFCMAVTKGGAAYEYLEEMATLAVDPGTIAFAVTPAPVSFSTVTLNGLDATSTATQTLDIGDNSGSGGGWNVTLSNTPFTAGTHVLASSDFTAQLPSAPSCDAGSTCEPAGWSGLVSYPYVLPGSSATKLLSAAAFTGMGDQQCSVPWTAYIPANAFSGTYASTWTVSLVSGP